MTLCSVEGCVRNEGQQWPYGPVMCVPHREQWAAEHIELVAKDERHRWRAQNTFTDPMGKPFTTWPRNWLIGA